MKKILEKIYDFFRYDLPYGIENLVVWFPIVWKDRQWGDQEIFRVLRHKLYLTYKNFKNSEIQSSKENSKDMLSCIFILDRFIGDKHHDIVFGKFYRKWGHPDFKFDEKGDAELSYPKVKNEVQKIECDADFVKTCRNLDFITNSDLDKLFRILRENILTWWD